jgi:hypothetical protein
MEEGAKLGGIVGAAKEERSVANALGGGVTLALGGGGGSKGGGGKEGGGVEEGLPLGDGLEATAAALCLATASPI